MLKEHINTAIISIIILAVVWLSGFFIGQSKRPKYIHTTVIDSTEYHVEGKPAKIESVVLGYSIQIPQIVETPEGRIDTLYITLHSYEIAKLDTTFSFPDSSSFDLNVLYDELKNQFSLTSKYRYHVHNLEPDNQIPSGTSRARITPYLGGYLANGATEIDTGTILGLTIGLKYKRVALGILGDSCKNIGGMFLVEF